MRKRDSGASLVEFAIMMPFLILLLIGIIEFAWLFSQNLDVRHGAREGARIAATDEFSGTNAAAIAGDICGRMDTADVSGDTFVIVTRSGDDIGDAIDVTVDAPGESLTGLLSWAIPSSLRLQSTVTVRLEQPPSWSQVPGPGGQTCP